LSPKPEAGPVPSFLDDIAAAIPDDLVALRPEDIRVEAEFVDLVITTSEPTSLSTMPVTQVKPDELLPGPLSAETLLPDAPPVSRISSSAPGEQIPVDAALGAVLPEITIEPPTILPANRVIGPVHEVVLQPAVVLAWSLLVLLSLPLAFIAGLLIGHFLWKSP
jgi:hypothetical protein